MSWYYAGGASPGFTYINRNANSTAGSGTTATVQLTGVLAGSLIVVIAGTYGATSINSVSDGTSSFTALGETTSSSVRQRTFYLLSSVATGTVTYTVTYGGSTGDRNLHVYQFSYVGTASYATATTFPNISASLDSGNITVAANNVCVVGAQDEAATSLSSTTINGNATGTVWNTSTLKSYQLVQSAGFTGDTKGTYGVSTRHTGTIAAFVAA